MIELVSQRLLLRTSTFLQSSSMGIIAQRYGEFVKKVNVTLSANEENPQQQEEENGDETMTELEPIPNKTERPPIQETFNQFSTALHIESLLQKTITSSIHSLPETIKTYTESLNDYEERSELVSKEIEVLRNELDRGKRRKLEVDEVERRAFLLNTDQRGEVAGDGNDSSNNNGGNAQPKSSSTGVNNNKGNTPARKKGKNYNTETTNNTTLLHASSYGTPMLLSNLETIKLETKHLQTRTKEIEDSNLAKSSMLTSILSQVRELKKVCGVKDGKRKKKRKVRGELHVEEEMDVDDSLNVSPVAFDGGGDREEGEEGEEGEV